MGKTSRTCDMKDTCRLLDALKQWNPFAPKTFLYGLVNGVTANEGVNVDKVLLVVRLIVESKVGEHIQDYSFKMKCQADQLGSKTSIIIRDQQVQVENDWVSLFDLLWSVQN